MVVNADAVLALAIAVQLLEPVARRNPKVVDVLGGVQNQELAVNNSLKVGAKVADGCAIPSSVCLSANDWITQKA
jgi:hypothetical protein